jgi:hypothetical protein
MMPLKDPLLDWIDGEKIFVKEPGCSPVLVTVRVWLSPAFYAFHDALLYSAHKYYPRLL